MIRVMDTAYTNLNIARQCGHRSAFHVELLSYDDQFKIAIHAAGL